MMYAGCDSAYLTPALQPLAAEFAAESLSQLQLLQEALSAAGGKPQCPWIDIGAHVTCEAACPS